LPSTNTQAPPFGVFAGGHRQLYDSHSREAKLADSVEALFLKYGVNVYFCGHQHSYARSLPVYVFFFFFFFFFFRL
jgi:hypothetical protein